MDERIRNSFSRQLRHDSTFKTRHHNFIEHKLDQSRNYIVDFEMNPCDGDDNFSLMNVEPIISVNKVCIEKCMLTLKTKMLDDKNKTKQVLKSLRKELSKGNVDEETINYLVNKQELLNYLVEFLFDFKNSEIQIETVWILNNLCIFCHRFNFRDKFFQIHGLLVNFMQSENSFSNVGVKNLILEKFYCLIGNLLLVEENAYHFYIANNIILFLLKNVNSSVRTLRAVCLWNINNIIYAFKNSSEINESRVASGKKIEESLINNKEVLYYLKFLFSRLDPSKNFDECYEFLWLLNYLSFENPYVIQSLFCKDGQMNMTSVRLLNKLAIFNNMHQPAIRLITNISSLEYSGNFNSLIIVQSLLENKTFLQMLMGIIRSVTSPDFTIIKNDSTHLLKDIMCLLKTLNYYDVKNIIHNYFIIDLISTIANLGILHIKINTIHKIVEYIMVILYSFFVSNNFIICDENLQKYNMLLSAIYSNQSIFCSDPNTKLIALDFILNFINLKHGSMPIELTSSIQLIETRNTHLHEDECRELLSIMNQYL